MPSTSLLGPAGPRCAGPTRKIEQSDQPMSFLLDSIPYFHCLVRREYTRNLVDGHGTYLRALAIAAWCRRGSMLGFQTVFTGEDAQGKEVPTGGTMFAQLP